MDSFQIVFMSFGFKNGIPPEASYLFDVRFLPNPYFFADLRALTGVDKRIQEWLDQWPETGELMDRLTDFLELVVPANRAEGKALVTICIGCTGGQHRSVGLVEKCARHFAKRGHRVTVIHRDLPHPGV